MVHLSDLDWNRAGDEAIKDFKKGDTVQATVLDVDSQKERISLGIKQVSGDPAETIGGFKKSEIVTCEVIAVQENGIEVKLADTDLTTFVKRSDLSRDRSEQRPERYNVGDKIDAAVLSSTRLLAVSPSRSRPSKSKRKRRLLRSTVHRRPVPPSETSLARR
jgi:small subunit ribosomal protein S1